MASKKLINRWEGKANLHPAISTHITRLDLTGSWRYMRPMYRNILPPCNDGCPAGNDIRGYIELALQERFDEAFNLILETSPFPSVCGRVCYHPCENACNRAYFDESISIHSIERYIGDFSKNVTFKKQKQLRKKHVGIVGSGPAGMSCAYHLIKKGFKVTVFESMPNPGGMLYYGIPTYRLPKDVLHWEIERILSMGVKLELNAPVDADAIVEMRRDFDALFLAFGAHGEQSLALEGEEMKGVTPGLKVLKKINAGEKVSVKKKRIIVVGGGNTAIDVARSVKRLGADPIILYRRTEIEMPAHPDEVKECREEGIEIRFLATPKRLIAKNGKLHAVECQEMELGKPDSSGRRRPVPKEGATYTMEVDEIYTAIGEKPELGPVEEVIDLKWNRINRNADGQTSVEGIYTGGDAGVNTSGTVVAAIGDGRRAAYAIEGYLLGQPSSFPFQKREIARYEDLNTDYFEQSPQVNIPHIPMKKRQGFDEVVGAIAETDIIEESSRCFSCGVCNYCLNCRTFCPDSAITYKDGKLNIDLNYCKGCGVCITECPRNAMCMEEE